MAGRSLRTWAFDRELSGNGHLEKELMWRQNDDMAIP